MPFDGSELPQIARDLIEGKRLLVEKGWIPACGIEKTGPHCVMTANYDATQGVSGRLIPAHILLCKAAGIDQNGPYWLTDWNDEQPSIESALKIYDLAIAMALNADTMEYGG